MKTSIAIVDYGMGNLRSVYQALRKAAPEAYVAIVEQPFAHRIVFRGRLGHGNEREIDFALRQFSRVQRRKVSGHDVEHSLGIFP